MDLLIKLFGEKKEENCCAVEIREVKRDEATCCTNIREQEGTARKEVQSVHCC